MDVEMGNGVGDLVDSDEDLFDDDGAGVVDDIGEEDLVEG
jgi:hypothetical protein